MKPDLSIILLSSHITDLISQLINMSGKLLLALAIIVIGFFVSKLVSKFIKKLLESAQIDKLGDKLNEIEFLEKSNFKIKFSSFLSKFFYYMLMIVFLIMATDVLNMPSISKLVTGLFELIPNIIIALIILVLGTLLAEELKKLILTTLESLGVPSAKLIASFVFYFLFINIALTALRQAKIDTSFLQQNISLLIAGVVLAFAIGYGFASKNTVSNFLASFYTNEKINIGDKIKISGTKGTVIDSDKSTITLRTENKSIVIIPLHKLSEEKIEVFEA